VSPAGKTGTSAVERVLGALHRRGAKAADVCYAESDSLEARVRGEEIDFVKQAHERTLGIRAFAPGDRGLRCAITSTSDLQTETLERMVDETLALARATAADPHAGLPGANYAAELPDLELSRPADREVSVEARIEDARAAERAARGFDPRIVNSEGSSVGSENSRFVYGNSDGFSAAYETTTHSLFSEPIARDGTSMQRDWAMTVGRRLDALLDPASVGRLAAERAVRRLGARKVPTCSVPVIFEPRVARSLLAHLAACVNGAALYREASFLVGRLDDAIASEGVTVIDDGRLPGGLGSRPFDGEGAATRRNVIVEDGRLHSFLLDAYSARKLGMASTGSAVRSAAGAPHPGTTNLWIEPGEVTPEAIRTSTPRGLYVTELIGMGFNPVTGDYSRGAAGLWIEDGEFSHAVEEVTIAGGLESMLRGIDAIGNDLEWIGATAAPTLRVAEMTVAGS